MARQKANKSLSLDERLENVNKEIENTEQLLIELKARKKELEQQIRTAHLTELEELITQKGLTFEDVKNLIINKDTAQ